MTQHEGNKKLVTLCIGCWTHGHPLEECMKTGAHIAIDAYLQRCLEQTKTEIKTAYQKNQKEAHKRYLCAYKCQQELHKKIRQLEYQHNHDSTGVVREQDRASLVKLEALRISCICVAHDEDPDIEFGSLDYLYVDNNELMLQFDLSIDNLLPNT